MFKRLGFATSTLSGPRSTAAAIALTGLSVVIGLTACAAETDTAALTASSPSASESASRPSTTPVVIPTIPQPTHSSSGLIVDYAGGREERIGDN